MKILTAVAISLMMTGPADAQPAPKATEQPLSPGVLKAQIEALKAPKVAWRAIAWKSCLMEGLKELRAQKKPVVAWVFIDRPADDARC